MSRAQHVVENAFGVLANRFRFLHTVIYAELKRVTAMVNAACVLHNFLATDLHSIDLSAETSTKSLFSAQPSFRGTINAVGSAVRESLCAYLNGRGAVSWQQQSAHLDANAYRRP